MSSPGRELVAARSSTGAILGRTREGKLNLESLMVPMSNFDRNSARNARTRGLHIVAIRAQRTIPHYPCAGDVQISR
jgi:hypothetical protein